MTRTVRESFSLDYSTWNQAKVHQDDATVSTIRTALFTYDDYDRSGNISPLKLARYFQWSRTAAYFSKDFVTAELDLYNTLRPFMTLAEYNIHESLYTEAGQWLRCGGLFPALLHTRLVSAGRSSLNMHSCIVSETTNTQLAELHFKMTVVDVNTRKSYQLPEGFKTRLHAHQNKGRILDNFLPLQRPANAFSFTVSVKPSDTDFNGHANNATYTQLCLDCAALASSKQQFQGFHGDIAFYNIQKMRMWYAGESRLGDPLSCYVWEDESAPRTLQFQVELSGRSIFHNTVLFYEKKVRSKL